MYIPAKRAEVGLKPAEFAEQALTSGHHNTVSEEARERQTFSIVTVDVLADFHLESLHFTTLNLAKKNVFGRGFAYQDQF